MHGRFGGKKFSQFTRLNFKASYFNLSSKLNFSFCSMNLQL